MTDGFFLCADILGFSDLREEAELKNQEEIN